MNKSKKNLEALRRHLGRDATGLKLLDAIARDMTDQRKRIALSDSDTERARLQAAKHKEDAIHAQTQIAQLKADLEAEKAKRFSVEALATRHAERIKKLESSPVEDEGIEYFYASDELTRVSNLLKETRKRFPRCPITVGNQSLGLEDFIKNYTTDEFAGLGMVMATLAIHDVPSRLKAARVYRDMNPAFNSPHSSRFALWCRSNIRLNTGWKEDVLRATGH